MLGALDGLLGGGLVDLAFLDRHVGEHGHLVGADFDKPFSHRQAEFLSPLEHPEFAGQQLGHQWHVLREHAQFPLHAGNHHRVHIVGVDLLLGGDNFQVKHGSEY